MLTAITLSIISSLIATTLLATSPLFLGLWIILITLFISFFISTSTTSWLGLIIFLIYVGGLLVIFAYFVAITPNLLIEGNTMLSITLLTSLSVFPLLYLLKPSDFNSINTLHQLPISNLLNENLFAILFLALILFFALVAVVKLSSSFSAPLRPFN